MILPPIPIVRVFLFICLPGGYNPDDGIGRLETMAHDERPQLETNSQHQETILIGRVVGIEEPEGILIQKDGLGLFEGDPMFATVFPAFCLIPFESNITHIYNVHIASGKVKSFLQTNNPTITNAN